jgi:ComF family protein
MKVLAISDYQYPLKKLILAKQYGKRVASKQLGELIWYMTYVRHASFEVIVPIPLHWTRYAWRGYNQAIEMGNVIAQESGKPLSELLYRSRRTVFQSTLHKQERQENTRNIFALTKFDRSLYRNKHILLVDDLLTTGATMREAARTLLTLNPASITGVVACRVP